MKINLETKRLLIREVRPEDELGFFELDSDPEVHRFLGNKPITTMDEARMMIENIQYQYKKNGIGRWAVIEKETGDFIGWTGLKLVINETNKHVHYYDLGYRFIRRFWGKGYASETMEPSLTYGFNNLQVSKIYAMADIQNIASNNVLKKAGLTFIETFRLDDAVYNWYKLLKEEWKEGKDSGLSNKQLLKRRNRNYK